MAKPEWGEKHRCSTCGKPFYDMKKTPIICPACGAENVPERLLKPRRTVGTTAATKKAPVAVEPKEDKKKSDDDDIDTDLVDPDTVDLPDDEDDDDLSGVVIAPKGDDES
jgi:uncharacterized protein (TIGR02300 family)